MSILVMRVQDVTQYHEGPDHTMGIFRALTDLVGSGHFNTRELVVALPVGPDDMVVDVISTAKSMLAKRLQTYLASVYLPSQLSANDPVAHKYHLDSFSFGDYKIQASYLLLTPPQPGTPMEQPQAVALEPFPGDFAL